VISSVLTGCLTSRAHAKVYLRSGSRQTIAKLLGFSLISPGTKIPGHVSGYIVLGKHSSPLEPDSAKLAEVLRLVEMRLGRH
jgi:hypothetical protein